MEFFATCPKGFEQLLAQELASFGVPQVRPLQGQVSFGGKLSDAYRVCMWSRLASRVLLVVDRVEAADSDALYGGIYDIAWEDHLPIGATMAIDAHGVNDALRNTQFTAVRAKDAVVDRLLGRRGTRPQIDTDRPDVTIAVRLHDDHASVAIDLSGEPLFRRGYEAAKSMRAPITPLRADYAAALLAQGGWFRDVRHGDAQLTSLFCGAGNVCVEAAGEVLDRAPGLIRTRWGFEGWAGHKPRTWERIAKEARDRAESGAGATLEIWATDVRRGAELATKNALHQAGVHADLNFIRPDEVTKTESGLVVCDMSWISPDDFGSEAQALSVASRAKGSRVVGIVADGALDAALSCDPAETIDVFVGATEGTIRSYDQPLEIGETPTVDLPDGSSMPVLVPTSDQFARRLANVAKERADWAAQEDVTCYRVYDADLPDYNVSIDLYQGSLTPGRWLQVSEYAAPSEIDETKARKRLMDVLAIAPRILDVSPDNVSLRVRTRSRGGSQYADEGEKGKGRGRGPRPRFVGGAPLMAGAHLVDEGGLTFEVNFSERLDCGIFLDHRETRSMVREWMKQTQGSKRFLNLFAYTGSATCYAADGGAKYTTTVDLSGPSLDWARRNMTRNGFEGDEHEFVYADAIRWVSDQRKTRNRWDLIFCDVPTFSNSKSMRSGSFDVQRDHAELIIGISRLLTRNGFAVFSCNLRDFEPDVEKLEKAGVKLEDITAETIPADFARNPKIHHAYKVTRVPVPGLADRPRRDDDRRGGRPGGHGGPRREGGPRSGGPRSGGFRGGRDGDSHGGPRSGGGFRGGRDGDSHGGPRSGGFRGGRDGDSHGGPRSGGPRSGGGFRGNGGKPGGPRPSGNRGPRTSGPHK